MANDLVFQPPAGTIIHGTLSSWVIAQSLITVYEQVVTIPGWPLCGATLRVRSINLHETVEMAGLAMRAITLTMTGDRNLMPERKAAWTDLSRTYAGFLIDAFGDPKLCAVEFGGALLDPKATYREFCRALKAVQSANRRQTGQYWPAHRPPQGWGHQADGSASLSGECN